jgi:hypothetical protein
MGELDLQPCAVVVAQEDSSGEGPRVAQSRKSRGEEAVAGGGGLQQWTCVGAPGGTGKEAPTRWRTWETAN